MEPPKITITKALTAALSEISPANGYHTDLSPTPEIPERVFRGRVIFGDNDPVPMVSILEVPVPKDGRVSDAVDNVTHSGWWELIIQGFVQDDKDNPTDPAQYLLFDIKRALAKEKCRDSGMNILGLGGENGEPCLVQGLRIGSGVVRPPDEVSAKAYCWVNIEIDLVERLN